LCFPPEVIVLAVGWELRLALSCRDVVELLAERDIQVDHTTISRWVRRFPRCRSRRPGPAATPSATAGSSTNPP
jgi:transposase, IS6 family